MFQNVPQSEELDLARRRARYRAWHRGTKELDFILGRYADAHIDGFSQDELRTFEALMECEETDLQQWLMGQMEMPDGPVGINLRAIRTFHLSAESNFEKLK